jgi:hypothetical protein
MPEDEDLEDDEDEEGDEEEGEDESDEEEMDQLEVLDSICDSLEASMDDCISATVVNDSYIELELNDGKKWKITIKETD